MLLRKTLVSKNQQIILHSIHEFIGWGVSSGNMELVELDLQKLIKSHKRMPSIDREMIAHTIDHGFHLKRYKNNKNHFE